MITVLLADDQALVRAGFRALLNAEPDIRVVAEAADGLEAVRLAQQTQPDVVLMDIRMPGVDGLEATRRIAADPALGGTKVVILTTFELDEYVFEALRTGASGFLVKDTEPVELLRGVRAVAAGDALLSPSVTRRVIGRVRRRGRPRPTGRPAGTARPAHRPGTRGAGAGRRGTVERRDRGPAGDQSGHREDPREPDDDQARRTGPCPAGGLRVRGGADPARLAGLISRRCRFPPFVDVITATGRRTRAARGRRTTMQYALLIYGDEKVWAARDERERQENHERHARFMSMLRTRDAARRRRGADELGVGHHRPQ